MVLPKVFSKNRFPRVLLLFCHVVSECHFVTFREKKSSLDRNLFNLGAPSITPQLGGRPRQSQYADSKRHSVPSSAFLFMEKKNWGVKRGSKSFAHHTQAPLVDQENRQTLVCYDSESFTTGQFSVADYFHVQLSRYQPSSG